VAQETASQGEEAAARPVMKGQTWWSSTSTSGTKVDPAVGGVDGVDGGSIECFSGWRWQLRTSASGDLNCSKMMRTAGHRWGRRTVKTGVMAREIWPMRFDRSSLGLPV
jgi:hypothetical protein